MAIRFRFVNTTDSLVSRIIRGAQFGVPYSHVEAVTPDGFYLGALMDGGVQKRASTYDNEYNSELIVSIPVSVDQENTFYNFLESKIGLPYDQLAIMEMAEGVLTGENPNWPTMNAYICSALQTAAAIMCGLFKAAPATVRLATPRDVLVGCAALVPLGQPTPRIK